MRNMFKDPILHVLVAEALRCNADECREILCILFVEVSELEA